MSKHVIPGPHPVGVGRGSAGHCLTSQAEQGGGGDALPLRTTVTGTLMGWCGFGLREGQANFAYRFAKAFWGQGFGTEVAQAVLAYGLAQYHLAPCTAVAFVENTASRRILEKLGFRVERYGGQDGKRVAYYTCVPC